MKANGMRRLVTRLSTTARSAGDGKGLHHNTLNSQLPTTNSQLPRGVGRTLSSKSYRLAGSSYDHPIVRAAPLGSWELGVDYAIRSIPLKMSSLTLSGSRTPSIVTNCSRVR